MQPTGKSERPQVELPVMARIMDARDEARDVRTLWLSREIPFQPGQFILVWIPGVDEKPYAVSDAAPGRIAITVSKRGPFSARLMEKRPGERLGLRGPYGHGFVPRPKGIIIAGGCGVVPLAPLKVMLPETPFICGARTAQDLIFRSRFPDMVVCTDDGSAGHHGFPTDLLRPHLEQKKADLVYTCGPEVMMRAVFDLCEKFGVECQAGLERYMKCGFGICGQCTCGEMLVCQDGPVFDSQALRQMAEFGRTARLKTGKHVTIEAYNAWRSA